MERREGGYVFVNCQCGKTLRFPYQNRALVITCPECKRSFLWFPDTQIRRLNFLTCLVNSLRERRWSTLTLIAVAAIATYLGYFTANRYSAKQSDLPSKPITITKRGLTPQKLVRPEIKEEQPIAAPENAPSIPLNVETSPHELAPSELLPSLKQVTSLPSGTNITPPYGRRGLGILTVINETRWDAAVKLVGKDNKLYRFVYVQKGERVNIDGIPPGSYYFRWCTGLDWDKHSHRFRQNCAFFEADKLLVFTEVSLPGGLGVRYVHQTVTLHEVPLGNLKKILISEDRFKEHK